MAELHETLMGRKLIEHTLPEIADQLKRIADSLDHSKVRELIKQFPNDADLGKHVREYFVRFK
jgi:hypothetical protein